MPRDPRTVRNLTQPADWWEAFEAAAAKEGVTLAVWVGQQCIAGLSKKVQSQLSERRGPGKPPKPA